VNPEPCAEYTPTQTQVCGACGWHRIDHSAKAGGIGNPPVWQCSGCGGRCACTERHTPCHYSVSGFHHDHPGGGKADAQLTYGKDAPRVRIRGLNL